MKQFLFLFLHLALFLAPLRAQSAIQDSPALPEGLRQALLNEEYAEAFEEIRGFQQSEEDPSGFWDYLEARTLQRMGRSDRALELYADFTVQRADSPWLHKVRFHQAEELARLGNWEEAERIWAEEVTWLRGAERQESLAGIYLELAETWTAPFSGAAQRAPSDFARARVLYTKSLDLDLGEALRGFVLERIAWCSEQQEQWPQAVLDYEPY